MAVYDSSPGLLLSRPSRSPHGLTKMALEEGWATETREPLLPSTDIRSIFYFSWLQSPWSSRLSTWSSPAHSQGWSCTLRLFFPSLSTCRYIDQSVTTSLIRPTPSAVCAYYAYTGYICKSAFMCLHGHLMFFSWSCYLRNYCTVLPSVLFRFPVEDSSCRLAPPGRCGCFETPQKRLRCCVYWIVDPERSEHVPSRSIPSDSGLIQTSDGSFSLPLQRECLSQQCDGAANHFIGTTSGPPVTPVRPSRPGYMCISDCLLQLVIRVLPALQAQSLVLSSSRFSRSIGLLKSSTTSF